MIKKSFVAISLAAFLLSGCSSTDKHTFANRARAQGAQFNDLAKQWEKADEMIMEGGDLFDKGKKQVIKGRSLADEGNENQEKGRALVYRGENLKMQVEAEYNRRYSSPEPMPASLYKYVR